MKNPTVQIKRLKKKDKNLCPCMFNLMTYVYKTVTVRFFMIWESHLLKEKWSLSQENMTSMKWISQRLSLRVEIHKDFKLYQVLMCSSRMLKCNNIPNIKVCTPLPFCWVGGWNFYQIFRKEGGGRGAWQDFRF